MANAVHGRQATFVGSLGIPFHGLVQVLFHAISVLMAEGEVEQCLDIATLGGTGKPFHGFGVVGIHSFSAEQAVAQHHLGPYAASLGITAHTGDVGSSLGSGGSSYEAEQGYGQLSYSHFLSFFMCRLMLLEAEAQWLIACKNSHFLPFFPHP